MRRKYIVSYDGGEPEEFTSTLVLEKDDVFCAVGAMTILWKVVNKVVDGEGCHLTVESFIPKRVIKVKYEGG